MQVWAVDRPGPLAGRPLVRALRDTPVPTADELLIAVEACGVCRTDVHLVLGELPARASGTVPGHQIVGRVVAAGPAARRFAVGDRVGVGWVRRTCGACPACRRGQENLCPAAVFTGWDADGGFAEYATVPDSFAHAAPAGLAATTLAPLLCAGIIGYRALTRARLPPGGRLGLWGFGSSAHITAQIAAATGAELVVSTRGRRNQELAARLGASFVGDADQPPPDPVDAAIVFAPAGELVPAALRTVRPGGTVVLAGIYMTDIPAMDYRDHLFGERDLRTVTANTRADADELLRLAARLDLRLHTTVLGFDDVPEAIAAIAEDRAVGSLVIDMVGTPAR